LENYGREIGVQIKLKIGVVVPTLCLRPEMLRQSLESIRQISGTYIVLVSPEDKNCQQLLDLGLVDKWVEDSGAGVAEAINTGFRALPTELIFVTWLGDDDQLVAPGIAESLKVLDENPDVVSTFGVCEYIDESGKLFWINAYGQRAVSRLRFGPDRIPQPGSILRRSALQKVGLLDRELKFAFDLDLFIKLSKEGKIAFVPILVSLYRWHPGSISSSSRNASNAEARLVRLRQLPVGLRPISWIWEIPLWLAPRLKSHKFDQLSRAQESR
jgi:GT2 family glycosyltransferase